MPKGSKVHKLPQGMPIAAFSAGGAKEKELEDFLTEQKVAGLLILQDGKIRMERYALGNSKSGRWTSQSVAKSVTSIAINSVWPEAQSTVRHEAAVNFMNTIAKEIDIEKQNCLVHK